MEVLRGTLGLDPHDYAVDDRLMEISYGEWEGLTLPEIDARMPGLLAERERDKWDFAPPGGESYRALTAPHQRMVRRADTRHRGCGAWRRRACAHGAVRLAAAG